MLKVVFDTNVFLRALINPHGINSQLILSSDKYKLFLSMEIIDEMIVFLSRSSLRKKYNQIKDVDVREILKVISDAEIIEPKMKIDICRDIDDNKFLECSVSGAADYLVSADKDLLDLVEYKGVKIISTQEFIKKLKSL